MWEQEFEDLKCQTGISSSWGGRRRSTPLAFTQEGVAMLSSVLHSAEAVRVNVSIMRTFVRLKRVELVHREFAERLERLEREIEKTRGKLGQHDELFAGIIRELKKLMTPPDQKKKPRIGFRSAKQRDWGETRGARSGSFASLRRRSHRSGQATPDGCVSSPLARQRIRRTVAERRAPAQRVLPGAAGRAAVARSILEAAAAHAPASAP